MSEVREIGAGETALAWPAMSELRPHLRSAEEFVRQVDELQRPEGYRLMGAFAPGAAEPGAVAGFRVAHSLSWGAHLYVDDLSTRAAARRQGLARALLDWLLAEAERLGLDQIHLDSGYGPERADAHRLYLNVGMALASHHFARRVPR